jgi:hypothetical protein
MGFAKVHLAKSFYSILDSPTGAHTVHLMQQSAVLLEQVEKMVRVKSGCCLTFIQTRFDHSYCLL